MDWVPQHGGPPGILGSVIGENRAIPLLKKNSTAAVKFKELRGFKRFSGERA
jgi:hypothetical protein